MDPNEKKFVSSKKPCMLALLRFTSIKAKNWHPTDQEQCRCSVLSIPQCRRIEEIF